MAACRQLEQQLGACSSWQAADSQQWQWDSWGWTEWQEWHASPWRTDPDPTWGDWSWRGQFQSEQDRYQNKFVKSETDDDDRSPATRKARRGTRSFPVAT